MDVNDRRVIAESLADIDQFRQLMDARLARASIDRDSVKNFVVLGKYLLSGGHLGLRPDVAPTLLAPLLLAPLVVDYSEFSELLKIHHLDMSWSVCLRQSWRCLSSTSRCSVCGRGWSVRTLSDLHVESGECYHTACYRLMGSVTTQRTFESLFAQAGFEWVQFQPAENGYWGHQQPWAFSWFEVKTPWGFIQIGKRKRVISLDWSRLGVEYLVPDDVTKGPTHAHAWSHEKAVEYLTALRLLVSPASP